MSTAAFPSGAAGRRARAVARATLATAALAGSWYVVGVRPSALVDAASYAALGRFVAGLFPPDLAPEFLALVARAAARTLAVAVAGVAIAVVVGAPLGLLATGTLWRRGPLVDAEPRSAGSSALAAASDAARALLGFLRAVPDLVWGVLFVVAVGFGPLAGVLALAASTAGVLGRIYADVFEDVDSHPVEALQAAGATRAQAFARGVLPQAVGPLVAFTLYLFECGVRAASVLGLVGAGGIGYEINLSMGLFEYGQVLTLMAALVALCAATEAASRAVRRRVGGYARPKARAGLLGEVKGPARRTRGWRALAVALATLVAWSTYETGLVRLAGEGASAAWRVGRFAAGLFPPALDAPFLRSLGRPLLETLGISVLGTLLGILIGGALSLPATAPLDEADGRPPGRPSATGAAARRGARALARLLLALLRSIPELIWALVCVLAVGIGPFAGTLAIGIHTGGVLGKLYAEAFEEVPRQPVEALRAAGAGPLQALVWGVWPQARSAVASYTVLRWETNLRVSTVLGLVGGGGLGQAIYMNAQLGFYQRVATLVLIVYALVVLTEWVSRRLRVGRRAIGAALEASK